MTAEIDIIGKILRIMNSNALGTFDPATDSLEALRDFLALWGGATGVGAILGVCSAGMAASTTVITCGNLAGLYEDDTFNSRFVMIVVKNNSALQTAPELEKRDITDFVGATGTFTTIAFSANVEENDIVLILPVDIASHIVAMGVFTTSSATVPADTGRTEANDFCKGCSLMPISGTCAFQPRPVRQFVSGTDVFTMDEPFTAAPGLVPYVILSSPYPVQRLVDIFTLCDAILELTETGGSVTTDGAEQTLYINNIPAAAFKPLVFMINTVNLAAPDTIHIKIYYRNVAGGALVLHTDTIYTGVQTEPMKSFNLHPNRHGIQITITETAGGHQSYVWDVLYEG